VPTRHGRESGTSPMRWGSATGSISARRSINLCHCQTCFRVAAVAQRSTSWLGARQRQCRAAAVWATEWARRAPPGSRPARPRERGGSVTGRERGGAGWWRGADLDGVPPRGRVAQEPGESLVRAAEGRPHAAPWHGRQVAMTTRARDAAGGQQSGAWEYVWPAPSHAVRRRSPFCCSPARGMDAARRLWRSHAPGTPGHAEGPASNTAPHFDKHPTAVRPVLIAGRSGEHALHDCGRQHRYMDHQREG
jgi:hypothetical protein